MEELSLKKLGVDTLSLDYSLSCSKGGPARCCLLAALAALKSQCVCKSFISILETLRICYLTHLVADAKQESSAALWPQPESAQHIDPASLEFLDLDVWQTR